MKKLIIGLMAIMLGIFSVGCSAQAESLKIDNKVDESDLSNCVKGYVYEGRIKEVIKEGDNSDTEFAEGSLLIEIKINPDEEKELIIVYLTEEMNSLSIVDYKAGDGVNVTTDYELNLKGAKDLPHVGAVSIKKLNSENI